MKYLLLLFISAITVTGANAQLVNPDYYNEVGIYGGVAPYTHPKGPQYVGDKNDLSYTASINYNHNFSEHLQAGLDVSMLTRWQATGTQTLNDLNGQTYGPHPITYNYSERTWAITARFNYVFPFYNQFHQDRFNFYVGIAGGGLFTINDAHSYYAYLQTPSNLKTAEQYRYVSGYDYEAGGGYTFGAQAGATYFFNNWLGVNVEVAGRFAHVNLVDNRIGGANGPYDIYYFPCTAGLRVRF